MPLAMLRIKQLFLSATPLYYGDLGIVRGWKISFVPQNSLNSF